MRGGRGRGRSAADNRSGSVKLCGSELGDRGDSRFRSGGRVEPVERLQSQSKFATTPQASCISDPESWEGIPGNVLGSREKLLDLNGRACSRTSSQIDAGPRDGSRRHLRKARLRQGDSSRARRSASGSIRKQCKRTGPSRSIDLDVHHS